MPSGETMRIIIPLVVILTYLIPLLLIAWLGLTPARTRFRLLGVSMIVISGTIIVLITQIGSSGLDYLVRWACALGLVAALVNAFRRWKHIRWSPDPVKAGSWIAIACLGVVGLFLSYLAVVTTTAVAAARSYVGKPMSLDEFPLTGGKFVVLFGGGNAVVNFTHTRAMGSRYALDIGALNRMGAGTVGLYPSDLTKYAAYDVQVVAPCSGSVAKSVDGHSDLRPGDMDVDHVFGNHVILHCNDNSLVMGHLKFGSVSVDVGQTVHSGDPIGRVGNSGNTMLPHLHIHAVQGLATEYARLREMKPIPMLFDERFLVQFDMVERFQ